MNRNEFVLRCYQRLPYTLQCGLASWHGRKLSGWRYSEQTETLVAQAREREYWTPEQWQQWHTEQLNRILDHAKNTVPYYRRLWAAQPSTTDAPDAWLMLENWTVLDKEALRAEPRAFLADDAPAKLEHEQTSGTTGKPIHLWYPRDTAQQWYALFEARWRGWYGLSRRDRWGILGGKMVTSAVRQSPPFWVWNAGFGQLYLSVYHLSPQNVPHYLKAIAEHRIAYLYGYTSALVTLAQEIIAQNLPRPPLSVILTNAEPLLAHQRELIETAFGCPVRETYGMAEMAAGASECEHGRLHLWLDAGYTEVLNDALRPVYEEPGSVITTGLLNPVMPLIRYNMGDQAVMAAPTECCPCGRTLPILRQIEGRTDDMLYTRDGRQIGRLDPVFKANLGIKEAQIIQESLDLVRVLVVPAVGYSEMHTQSIRHRLQERLGTMEIAVETAASIPRTANGKFRAVLCRLSEEEKQRASGAKEGKPQ